MNNPRIRLRELKLRGARRDYGLKFTDDAGGVRPISIIAGQISTGKSSILEFCDYCLGAGSHPQHPEFRRAAIYQALLEVVLDGVPYVIERSTFTPDPRPRLHICQLKDMDEPHQVEVKPLRPPGSDSSLSSWLLEALGLRGAVLKEAPTQEASGVDPLSFRDVMSLCFVSNERLGSKVMLHETEPPKSIKMRQVIDLIFAIDEQTLTSLSRDLQQKEEARQSTEREAQTLAKFLNEQLPDPESALEQSIAQTRSALAEVDSQVAVLDQQLRARSDFADRLRSDYGTASANTRDLSTRLRDRETLLKRLLALRGQYVSDITRLRFFSESHLLFNPLAVRVCPVCQSELDAAPSIVDGQCSLCGQQVRPYGEEIDADREIRHTQARLTELDRYVAEIELEIARVKVGLAEARDRELVAQAELDRQVASTVAPFVSNRDSMLRRRQELSAEVSRLEQAVRLRVSVHNRRRDADRLQEEIEALRKEIARVKKDQPTRDALLSTLGTRFEQILKDFRYPKLSDVALDDRYSPQVRGLHYTQLSAGARTLVGLAWHLALLEVAVDSGAAHPGFLMLDGLQKNLRPVQSVEQDAEFQRPEIVDAIYDHIISWCKGAGSGSQLIIVDNAPPQRARDEVVVEYSGDANRPPYGLIEDIVD